MDAQMQHGSKDEAFQHTKFAKVQAAIHEPESGIGNHRCPKYQNVGVHFQNWTNEWLIYLNLVFIHLIHN